MNTLFTFIQFKIKVYMLALGYKNKRKENIFQNSEVFIKTMEFLHKM